MKKDCKLLLNPSDSFVTIIPVKKGFPHLVGIKEYS